MVRRLSNWVGVELTHGKHLVAAGLWSVLARLAGIAATFVVGVVLARLLGPEALGVYGIVVAVALVLSVIAQAGLPTLATREIAVALSTENWPAARGALQGFAVFVCAASIVLGMLLAIFSIAAPEILGRASTSYGLGSLLVPLFALTVLVGADLRAFGGLVIGQSLDTLVRPLALIVFCLVAHSIFGALTSSMAVTFNAAAALVGLLFGVIALNNRVQPAIRSATPHYNRASWLRTALPLALVDWLRQVDGTYGIILVGVLSSDLDAGYFRLAFSVSVCVGAPLAIFHQVLAPTIAQLMAADEMTRLQRLLRNAAFLMTTILLLEFLVIAFASRPIISAVFGSAYADASLPLVFLTGAQLVNAIFGASWMMLAMGGGERILTVSFVISVATSILAAIALGLVWGMPGVAAASVIGAMVQSIISWQYGRSKYGVDGSFLSILSRANSNPRRRTECAE